MRMLTVSIVIAPLVLIGALPAAAGQSTPALGSGAPVLLAAGNDTPADRDTYTQQARKEMQEWQRKLHDFSEKAEAKGKEAANAAENDLNKAWTKAEAASSKLQTLGAEKLGERQNLFRGGIPRTGGRLAQDPTPGQVSGSAAERTQRLVQG
jgi:hypothetical protein